MNSPFIGDLVIRVLPHWEIPEGAAPLYELTQRFGYVSHLYGQIMVPKGFITDFGSVPTFAKPIIDNDDPDLLYAAVIHDYLYRHRGFIDGEQRFNRWQADCLLREAMLAAGAPAFKAWLVYRSVRIGGGHNWPD